MLFVCVYINSYNFLTAPIFLLHSKILFYKAII